MARKIGYTSFSSPHYFEKLFIFFLIICFIFALVLVSLSDGFSLSFVIMYVVILFLLISVAVLYEMKNMSEYMSPMEVIMIRQFFVDFNYSKKKEKFIHKYNTMTQKKLKKIMKKKPVFELTNIIKKNDVYELHICEKDYNLLYLFKFLLSRNNHVLFVKEEKDELKIIRIG